MIFVTVGTQLPFDRLLMTIDHWASKNETEIFAQIGNSKFLPQHIDYSPYLTIAEVEELFKKASVIVSHAGMGSIISALKYKKPIIIFPRLVEKGEHRNNHQLATAKWLENKNGIKVAWDETALMQLLNEAENLKSGDEISDYASPELLNNLKRLFSDRRKRVRPTDRRKILHASRKMSMI